ncbi:MAG TPA: GFA family protein [Vitreimonas sp.]|uniref:GFA family protein n=1 Tax=Vitreimonas sp. TaxID=3069702 RepID=UPI002D3CDB42|nr:GFA family protein [Vitreimonas sp.]HYD86418.1 GFA family protein [Vitreimonas sp.]
MTTRIASCSCGQLRVTCEGEPVRVSICHCLDCQKRSGSVFATQARFPREGVTIEGDTRQWSRRGDGGGTATFNFCPVCGSTVCWSADFAPDVFYVTVGAFADPSFPPPTVSVYEERKHPWALAAGELPMERQF